MEVSEPTKRPTWLSFVLGLTMGVLLVIFQKAHIQPLSWLPESLTKHMQAVDSTAFADTKSLQELQLPMLPQKP